MGVWTRLGGREFAVTFEAFIFDESGRFANVSQTRVQSTLEENLDSYNGQFQSYTLDEDGNAIRLDSSGRVAARRISLASSSQPAGGRSAGSALFFQMMGRATSAQAAASAVITPFFDRHEES